ncbi:Protein Y38F2AR.3 a [Aphelenchoides avenae]|nr:Protein Y38F2AR.3 a [Aphelenchus avenae]
MQAALYTSGTIFTISGLLSAPEAIRRFEAYAVGKNFASPRNALRRKLDYAFVAFVRNGFKPALLIATLTTALVVGVTHLTEYRNKFSWTYFPAVSASVCAILAVPLRVRGMASAASIGLSAGLLLSGVSLVAALEQGVSFDDTYWIFKQEVEHNLQTSWDREQKIKEICAKEKVWRPQAIKMLEENEKRNALFAKQYAEEAADAHPESD